MLTEDSLNDFNTEKVAYVDEQSPLVADENNKDKLIKPVSIVTLTAKLKRN